MIIFVTGIDTNIGKTYATGLLAKYLMSQGKSVITQKFIQTGCEEFSEDIQIHRKLMNINSLPEDNNLLTAPQIFKYPASPHLAANLEKKIVDTSIIEEATSKLAQKFDYVIIEGAGGLMVPLDNKGEQTIIDYLEQKKYPIILVTSPKLGSLNHTILSLEAISKRKLPFLGVIYNKFIAEKDLITEDSLQMIKIFLQKFHLKETIISIGNIENNFDLSGFRNLL